MDVKSSFTYFTPTDILHVSTNTCFFAQNIKLGRQKKTEHGPTKIFYF